MNEAVYLLLGLVVGALLGWLLGSRRSAAPADGRLENELRQQVGQRDGELSQTREQLAAARTAVATAEARQAGAETLLIEQRGLHERALAQAKVAQDKALADMREAFKALSADALTQQVPEFIRQATGVFGKFQETAAGDLNMRQESIKGLIEPLKDQLQQYQTRLQQSETAQSSALGEVKQQLQSLSTQSASLANETQQFRMVLHSSQTRGRWGEETLRRVIEASGMSAHCDFDVQVVEGESRPDLIVRLPGDRCIIVDAKVPDLDVFAALESADAQGRALLLKEYAAKVTGTIKSLADRRYPEKFEHALDFVVLFMPAESLFSAALEGDRELIVWAAERQILLATPASLIALLRSVSVSWQQFAQTENTKAIAEAALEFYSRMVKFVDHFESIGAGLEKATSAFNGAVRSYQTRVRPQGQRLVTLGVVDEAKGLAELSEVHVELHDVEG